VVEGIKGFHEVLTKSVLSVEQSARVSEKKGREKDKSEGALVGDL